MKPSRTTAAALALALPLVGGSAAYASVLDESTATESQDALDFETAEDRTGIDAFQGWSEGDFDAYQAYWVGGFSYEQLIDLAVEWNLSEFEAKARAGQAVLDGDTSEIVGLVGQPDPDAGAEAAAMYAELDG